MFKKYPPKSKRERERERAIKGRGGKRSDKANSSRTDVKEGGKEEKQKIIELKEKMKNRKSDTFTVVWFIILTSPNSESKGQVAGCE